MRSNSPSCRGFTLIELLVSIAIIAILITLVTIGVGHALRTSKGAADRQTVVSLNQGVQAFKQEFGFLPPLALHDEAAGIQPVARWSAQQNPNRYQDNGTNYFINASGSDLSWNYGDPSSPYWSDNYLNKVGSMQGNNYVPGYLEGFGKGSSTPNLSSNFRSADSASVAADRRFSEYSLAFYLVGALPGFVGTAPNKVLVDGVDGPGMFAPNPNGTFDASITQRSRAGSRQLAQQGKSYPPLVDTSRGSPRLFADSEMVAGDFDFVTRYKLMSPFGKPYRYYRWQPQDSRDRHGNGAAAYQTLDADGKSVAEDDFDRLRVPGVVGNPRENSELRSAEYAIVSCGPDSFFGDMKLEADSDDDFAAMQALLKVQGSNTRKTREAARKDNIVEVGR